MQILFFGTFDEQAHPRVRALREGLAAAGNEVDVVNAPLGVPTSDRVALARNPARAPLLVIRILRCWVRLWRAGRGRRPDVVVVGYLGHFDIHLARLRFRRSTLVLDHMVSLGDTARDRGLGDRSIVARLLDQVDRWALRAADVVVVDTIEQGDALPHRPEHLCVVPVSAPEDWAKATPASDRRPGEPLRVVFFGLYTPLQGAPTIGEALALLRDRTDIEVTMVGRGQDLESTQRHAAPNPRVEWIDWVEPQALPALVAAHHVCLGVFGDTPKALRVVPNKVWQGATAGCAIVTSDTPTQRRALGDAACFVPPADPHELARVLRHLADDDGELADRRTRLRRRMADHANPARAVEPLHSLLTHLTPEEHTMAAPSLSLNAWLRWDVIAHELSSSPPATVLELGAGQGSVAARLADRYDYTGVEPDAESRAITRARLGPSARVLGDVSELDPAETFDLVCAFEVIEHLEDDRGMVGEWARFVKPGGRMLISVPAHQDR
ncbi:MAG: methyltransferase domain-containing protein, partial [Acidimicrobiales bacterium]